MTVTVAMGVRSRESLAARKVLRRWMRVGDFCLTYSDASDSDLIFSGLHRIHHTSGMYRIFGKIESLMFLRWKGAVDLHSLSLLH